MKVLVVNCGSSSIKYQLRQLPENQALAVGIVERIGERGSALEHQWRDQPKRRRDVEVSDHHQGMTRILETLTGQQSAGPTDRHEIAAVGHRVVHGGEKFSKAVRIDQDVIRSIEEYADLAPLHNPPNLVGIRAAMQALPEAAQVACFDTAFHATLPEVAYLYALPYEFYQRYGIRRYGFHGTSHRYVTSRAAAFLRLKRSEINCLTCHLGNGCSITAVRRGRSVDTSMGLTPLEGLLMGTRSGDFDPAILFYLADHGYDMATLSDVCNKRSGLLGISGQSNDMRSLSSSASAGNARAKLAIDMFCYRVRKYIGAYMAVAGPLHAVVFTGGIGANAANVRQETCRDLEHLGISLDPRAQQRLPRQGNGHQHARQPGGRTGDTHRRGGRDRVRDISRGDAIGSGQRRRRKISNVKYFRKVDFSPPGRLKSILRRLAVDTFTV